mmetsp:Transcript_109597/g.316881  ORF Transcript_109597/g.316881 Transcript_109597/m.316881 type:complete len:430 (+) Transcript_109597:77-1366(+)|eukprot:CAMPEP_0176150854 /NCGR_PEP_ID=MMETSP0120_2-20121206/77034_1 /TAXON_ID=160619 /ORGANISM="Kryptoperidinium foliaceum, Strain CCMP 1326" /LENGTH=429 /DNA_ID=CAMNT_0017487801 /DNA_START=73 /DNA_END=1362 /DNA_ORIENTATION=-
MASPPVVEDAGNWRENLAEGSRVWVLKASLNLWYEGVVIKRSAGELKVRFMDGTIPCFKTVSLYSEEVACLDSQNVEHPKIFPTAQPNVASFRASSVASLATARPRPAGPAEISLSSVAAVQRGRLPGRPVLSATDGGMSTTRSDSRGRIASPRRANFAQALDSPRSSLSPRSAPSETSSSDRARSRSMSATSESCPMMPMGSGKFAIKASMGRTYTEASCLTHGSMPDLTPFGLGTQDELPLPDVDECAEANFGAGRGGSFASKTFDGLPRMCGSSDVPRSGLTTKTFDGLPLMRGESDVLRGRSTAPGSRVTVRSASVGKCVEGICLDSNEQTMRVLYTVGRRNYVETFPTSSETRSDDNRFEEPRREGSLAPGMQVRVRSASVGRPVEGIVTDATGDKVRVQYFLHGRCYVKTLSVHEAEPNLEIR